MHLKLTEKKRAILEIVICFFLMMLLTILVNLLGNYLNLGGLMVGVLAYLLPCIILIFYVLKIEKSPLSSIGLKKIRFQDIPLGLLLGICMFITQQIPLLIIKLDYSAYAMEPDFVYILVMSLYCFLCVGFVEELIFRGFILQKTYAVCSSKIFSIVINILLFYAIHWASMQYTLGEFYNISVNVIFLSVYFFKSKHKSLLPLIIAHSLYDMLTSILLPIFVFYTM